MRGKFLFLGTGGSLGVPILGCECSVCASPNPRNKRLRSSGVVSIDSQKFLIDAGPDLRTQALRHRLTQTHGVLLTHSHFDHIAGIDDLRAFAFRQKQKIPCLLSLETFEELKVRYHYLLHTPSGSRFAFEFLQGDFGAGSFQGVEYQFLSYRQAGMKVSGFRFGNFAYVSDIREYSERVFESLKGVEVLVVSALRYTPNEAHFSLGEAVAFSQKVGARTTWLTHITHDLEYEKVNKELPPEIQLAYDGLEIQF